MKPVSVFHWALLCLIAPTLLLADIFRGEVRDELTDVPIEGATVELRLDELSADPDFTVETDPFGLFEITDVASAATYDVLVTHPAYIDENDEVTIDVARKSENYELTPRVDLPGGPDVTPFDLYVQVYGTTTYLELDTIPVTVTQYLSQFGGAAVNTRQVATNSDGSVIVRGLTPGWYEIEINGASSAAFRSGWESYPKAGDPFVRDSINQTSTINVLLKPEPQELTFRVETLDFITNTPDPFDFPVDPLQPVEGILVEITAFDPNNEDRELMEPLNEITDEDGEVTFTKLPGVSYKVEAKAIGYYTLETEIDADFQGRLPTEVQILEIQPERQFVTLIYEFPDYSPVNCDDFRGFPNSDGEHFNGTILDGLQVTVEGVPGSVTEGIKKTLFNEFDITFFPCNPTSFSLEGPFRAGRYRVTIRGRIGSNFIWGGQFGSSFFNAVTFPVVHEEFIEIVPNGPGNLPTTDSFLDNPFAFFTRTGQTIELRTQPETVTGRLLGAEEIALSTIAAPNGIGDPVFEGMAGYTLTFRQPPELDLFENFQPVTATTAADGSYSVELLPGIYTVEVTGTDIDSYMGDAYVYEVTSPLGGRTPGEQMTGAWPVVDQIPDGFNFATSSTYFNGSGVAINGGDAPVLDLFVRKELYYLEANVELQGPTKQRLIFRSDLGSASEPYLLLSENGATAKVTDLSNNEFTADWGISPLSGSFSGNGRFFEAAALFETLPPGQYSFALSHPDYAFESQPTDAFFPDFPRPGKVPDQALIDAVQQAIDDFIIFSINDVPRPLSLNQKTPVRATEASQTRDVSVFFWVDTDPDPQVEAFDYVEGFFNYLNIFDAPGYAPGLYVSSQLPDASGVGQYVSAFYENQTRIFRANPTDSIFLGGDSASTEATLPDLDYNLELIAVSELDSSVLVPGVKLTLASFSGTPENITTTSSPLTFSSRTAPLEVADDFSDNFILNRAVITEISSSGDTPTVKVTAYVEQAIEIRATVENAALNGIGIEGVPLKITDSYGNQIDTLIGDDGIDQTDEAGQVTITNIRLRDLFVVTNFPGFEQSRDFLQLADLQTDPNTSAQFFAPTIILTPLDRPSITTTGTPIDRFGGVLPGVTRSGDASAFDGFAAKDTLTATWTVDVNHADIDYFLPSFEDATGTSGPSENIVFNDGIRRGYLVDLREFSTGDDGQILTNEVNLPASTEPDEFVRLLQAIATGRDITDAAEESSIFIAPSTMVESVSAGSSRITGTFSVADIPPGDLQPAIIVESLAGAFTFYKVDMMVADNMTKRLTGIDIPEWMGFLFDFLGVSAGISATQSEIEKYVPQGAIIPFPDFSATISEAKDDDGAKTGFIDYEYKLDLGTKVGPESPAGGLASLGPGLLGAEIKANGTISSTGDKREIGVSLSADISQDTISEGTIDSKKYVPKIATSLLGVTPKIESIGVGVSSNIVSSADINSAYLAKLLVAFGGDIDVSAEMDLSTITGKIPYAGPVLVLLSKTGLLKTTVNTAAGLRIVDEYVVETVRPSTVAEKLISTEESDDPDPRVGRRNFLGGRELGESATESTGDPRRSDGVLLDYTRTVGVGFGSNLAATSEFIGQKLGANAGFELTGPKVRGKGSLAIQFNQFGDYPLVKRIQGQVDLVLNAYAKTSLGEKKKNYTWTALSIDAQYGTETVFEVIPMELEYIEQTFADFGSNVFTGDAPSIAGGVAPFGTYAGAPAGGGALVTLVNGAMVELVLAPRGSDQDHGTPEQIASLTTILASDILELDDGRILVVWAEPSGSVDPNDPLAPNVVKFSVSDTNGENFSAAANAFSLSGSAADLHLVQSGSAVYLVTRMMITGNGPPIHQLFGQTFDRVQLNFGNAFSFLAQETTGISELAVTGPGSTGAGDIAVYFIAGDDTLKSLRWAGGSPTGLATIDTEIDAGLAATSTSTEFFVIASAENDELRLYTSDSGTANNGTETSSVVAEGVDPREAQLVLQDVTQDGGLLYSFTQGTLGGSEICFLFIDDTGAPLSEGVQHLTQNNSGTYSQLSISVIDSETTFLYALFENSPPEIRVFEISVTEGSSGNDSDEDGINDLGELQIIDADSEDSIATLADVIGTDDFDLDGFDNATEIELGSDPADEFSVPVVEGLPTVSVAAALPDAGELDTVVGRFDISRSGATDAPLTVNYTTDGTATADTDYTALPGSLEIPSAASLASIAVTPIRDNLSEGVETVVLTISSDDAYTIGNIGSATINIGDLPADAWRFLNFGADANTLSAGDLADFDKDGIPNLLEYALKLDPRIEGQVGLPVVSIIENEVTDERFLTFSYTENDDGEDLIYEVEVSPDLGPDNWTSGNGVTVEVSRVPLVDGGTTVTVRNTTPIGNDGSAFMRLSVERR
ncbi:MAG: Calx-beta domain-containing protein [Verrucomicrobiota bacterium]